MPPAAATPAPAPARRLLNYREAAEALGVSERTIFAWAKDGSIAVTRLGRLVRIHPDEIDRIAREGVA